MAFTTFISPCSDQRWDPFVEKHHLGWISHSSAWKKVIEASFSHLKGYYIGLLEESTQSIKAAIPVYVVKSCVTGTRLVSIPFSTLCDPLVSSVEEAHQLLQYVLGFAKEQNVAHTEIRCLNSGEMMPDVPLGRVDFFVHHFLDLNTSLEKLRKRFHRTCVVQRIRRAQKSELKIIKADSEKELKDFYTIYVDLRKRLMRPPIPFRFFKHLWEMFSPHDQIQLLLAQKDGKTLAGIILFKFKKRVSIEFAASFESAWNLSPNHLLFWEAIQMAHSEGYEIIDFGRTAPNNTPLMDFKRRWGTETMVMPQYFFPKEIAEKYLLRESSFQFQMVQSACRYAPRAILPMIGNFCYRHMS
jgi:hypothetical protein